VTGGIRSAAIGGITASGTGLSATSLSALGGGVAGGGGGVIHIDIHDNHVMSQKDMDDLVNKVGHAVATRILPSAGVRVRFS
jgi:hypothetical protein